MNFKTFKISEPCATCLFASIKLYNKRELYYCILNKNMHNAKRCKGYKFDIEELDKFEFYGINLY